jgi:hypothetical protein
MTRIAVVKYVHMFFGDELSLDPRRCLVEVPCHIFLDPTAGTIRTRPDADAESATPSGWDLP